jgi:hypothetical protein
MNVLPDGLRGDADNARPERTGFDLDQRMQFEPDLSIGDESGDGQ